MSNQSTINDNNPDLQALGRAYQAETERLERIMMLPSGYQVGFACIQGEHGSRTWELNVFHCDETGEIDFDTAIAQGTLQEVETALHTLMAADHAHAEFAREKRLCNREARWSGYYVKSAPPPNRRTIQRWGPRCHRRLTPL